MTAVWRLTTAWLAPAIATENNSDLSVDATLSTVSDPTNSAAARPSQEVVTPPTTARWMDLPQPGGRRVACYTVMVLNTRREKLLKL